MPALHLAIASPDGQAPWHFVLGEPAGFNKAMCGEEVSYELPILDGVEIEWPPIASVCSACIQRLAKF